MRLEDILVRAQLRTQSPENCVRSRVGDSKSQNLVNVLQHHVAALGMQCQNSRLLEIGARALEVRAVKVGHHDRVMQSVVSNVWYQMKVWYHDRVMQNCVEFHPSTPRFPCNV